MILVSSGTSISTANDVSVGKVNCIAIITAIDVAINGHVWLHHILRLCLCPCYRMMGGHVCVLIAMFTDRADPVNTFVCAHGFSITSVCAKDLTITAAYIVSLVIALTRTQTLDIAWVYLGNLAVMFAGVGILDIAVAGARGFIIFSLCAGDLAIAFLGAYGCITVSKCAGGLAIAHTNGRTALTSTL
jgi:hypothetical protein